MRPNSDLGEVRWFFENYHFPSFVYEYPKDIAPMDHLEREAARNHTLAVIQSYWKTLQAKAFVRGVVVDQEGIPFPMRHFIFLRRCVKSLRGMFQRQEILH